MKTLTSLKYITAIIAIIIIAVIFNGCKKADLQPEPTYDNNTISKVKANVANQIKEAGGIPIIFNVNKPVTTYWADKDGKEVTKDKLDLNNFTSTCDADYPAYTNLVQYTRTYRCLNSPEGYEIQFEYELSWNKNVLNKSTLGFIEIVNNSTGVTEATYTISGKYDVIVTDKGPDSNPSFPNNEIFSVSFRSAAIPRDYINGDIFANTYTVKVSATFGTDCSYSYSLYSLPVGLFGFTTNTGLAPCDRNEKAWFQNSSLFNNKKIGVSGYDPVFSCSNYGGSFVRTDLQEVGYWIIGLSTTWQKFSNATIPTSNNILANGFLQQTDFAESPVITVTTPTTYTVILRYRNWKYNGTPPSPLVVPILSTACRYMGIPYTIPNNPVEEDYASYSYEYITGQLITP